MMIGFYEIIGIIFSAGLVGYLSMILLEFLAIKAEANAAKNEKYLVISVRVAKDNETSPLVAEQIYTTLHSIASKISFWDRLKGVIPEKISFEIASINKSIRFYVVFPSKLKNLIEGQIYAQYPFVEIEDVADYAFKQEAEIALGQNASAIKEGRELTHYQNTAEKSFSKVNLFSTAMGMELGLVKPEFLPIKQYGSYEDKSVGMNIDPLSSITSTLAKFNDVNEQAWIQMVISPVHEGKKDFFVNLYHAVIKRKFFGKTTYKWFQKTSNLKRKIWFLWTLLLNPKKHSAGEEDKKTDQDLAVENKLSELLYQTNLRIVYIPKVKDAATIVKLKEIAGSFKQFNIPNLNGFAITKVYQNSEEIIDKFQSRALDSGFLLNVKELATLYHLPNNTVQTPNIYWVRSKKIEPPNDLPAVDNLEDSQVTAIGKSNFRGLDEAFGIKTLDRRRHMYIIGKTGMGKSTMLENMLFSDIRAGKGVAVVDPHGDLAESVINFVPSWRTNDVIIVDPSDREFPIAFNMLGNVDPTLNTIVASGLVGIFKKIYADSWGPRLEHILRNTILSLLEYPNTTLLGIPRILQDADFRKKVIRKVQDPLVKSFWINEFEKLEPRQRIEAISPILNKVGQFLSSPIIRNILGQVNSKLDFRFAMDNKKIVIVNLSKGKIGEDNSSLLGAMIITKFQIDAMSRANQAEKDRTDFYLYVDEFQNFATDSFATILSEARKYKLNLTMANQYIAQMPEEVRDAVFGNVGSILSFQVGFDDADYLSQQYGEEVLPNDLVNLSKYTAYMRLLIDGMPSKTFSLNTLPPPDFEVEEGRREKVIKMAREKYCTPRLIVEDKINRWSRGVDLDENILGAEKKPMLKAGKKFVAEKEKPRA